MATLIPENIEELTFFDNMVHSASLSKARNNGVTIVMGSPADPDIPGVFMMEQRIKDVEVDGEMVPQQYYSKVWRLSNFLSTDTSEALNQLMDMLLEGTYEHIEMHHLEIPEDSVSMGSP